MFQQKKPLCLANLTKVPNEAGIYIIYKNGRPFYIGRSIVNIHSRLCAHASGRGSRKIKECLVRGERLEFEWQELSSPHQAEAQLIAALGTVAYGNLRRETDPADW